MKAAMTAGLVLMVVLGWCPATAQTIEFDSCGALFSDGVECLALFRADDGQFYRIENIDGFSPPDRVHVVGALVQGPACAGVPCAVPIAGCITQNTIAQCPDVFDTDHFKCYRVDLVSPRPGQFRGRHDVTLEDQFEQEPRSAVRPPELLCNPVRKNGEEIKTPDEAMVCYKTTPPARQPEFGKREIIVSNQFGRQTLQVRNRDNLLCVPSRVAAVPQCGGTTGQECALNEACDRRDATCSLIDPEGVCVPRREVCFTLFAPVCGCDGVTYSNDCERIKAGATLAHPGEC
jgi:hypothetical protein